MNPFKRILFLPIGLMAWLIMGVHVFVGWITDGKYS